MPTTEHNQRISIRADTTGFREIKQSAADAFGFAKKAITSTIKEQRLLIRELTAEKRLITEKQKSTSISMRDAQQQIRLLKRMKQVLDPKKQASEVQAFNAAIAKTTVLYEKLFRQQSKFGRQAGRVEDRLILPRETLEVAQGADIELERFARPKIAEERRAAREQREGAREERRQRRIDADEERQRDRDRARRRQRRLAVAGGFVGAGISALATGVDAPERPFAAIGQGAQGVAQLIPGIGRGLATIIGTSFSALERTFQESVGFETARMGAFPFMAGGRNIRGAAALGFRPTEAVGRLSQFGQAAQFRVPGAMDMGLLENMRRGMDPGAMGALSSVFRVGGQAGGPGREGRNAQRLISRVMSEAVAQGMDAAQINTFMRSMSGVLVQMGDQGIPLNLEAITGLQTSFAMGSEMLRGQAGIVAMQGLQQGFQGLARGGGTSFGRILALRAARQAGAQSYSQSLYMMEQGLNNPAYTNRVLEQYLGTRAGAVTQNDPRGVFLGREFGVTSHMAREMLRVTEQRLSGEITEDDARRRILEAGRPPMEVPEFARLMPEIEARRVEFGADELAERGPELVRAFSDVEIAAAGTALGMTELFMQVIPDVTEAVLGTVREVDFAGLASTVSDVVRAMGTIPDAIEGTLEEVGTMIEEAVSNYEAMVEPVMRSQTLAPTPSPQGFISPISRQ